MNTVRYDKTLVYYDGPQVIEAYDESGGRYVGVLGPAVEGQTRYLIKEVTATDLDDFRVGKIDLRTMLLHLENSQWYLSRFEPDLNAPIVLEHQTQSIIDSDFLPDTGYFMLAGSPDDFVIEYARRCRKTVLALITNPVHGGDEHRIRWDVYNKLLDFFQSLLKHAYNAELMATTSDERKRKDLANDDAYMMDVIVPATTGSVRVILASTQEVSLVNDFQVDYALKRVDELFQSAINYPNSPHLLDKHRGQLAGVCLDILSTVGKHEIDIGYAWASPDSKKTNQIFISANQAKNLVTLLSANEDIGSEKKSIVGEFHMFNRNARSWGLLVNGTPVPGKIDKEGPTLDGLEVGKTYRFDCVERVTKATTSDDKRVLYLQKYIEVKSRDVFDE